MRKQSRNLSPVTLYPLHVLGAAVGPPIRSQRSAMNEVVVGNRRLRVGEVAEVDGRDSQPFCRAAGNQVIDVTADAERCEDRPGPDGFHLSFC